MVERQPRPFDRKRDMLEASRPGPTARVQPPDFESLYADDADPWQVESSWYERRKLAILLASLPRERYSTAWEPGCGIGVSTAALARRCDHLVASDSSAEAVRRTRRRTADLPHVETVVSQVPEIVVPRGVDLLVIAEFLYYLPDPPTAVDRLWSVTEPGTHVLVEHWAHRPDDAFVSGPEVQQLVADYAGNRGARLLVKHHDEDFGLDVYEVTR